MKKVSRRCEALGYFFVTYAKSGKHKDISISAANAGDIRT